MALLQNFAKRLNHFELKLADLFDEVHLNLSGFRDFFAGHVPKGICLDFHILVFVRICERC